MRGLVGEGSDAFFAEMTDQVIPAVRRLAAALDDASRLTRQIGQTLHNADMDVSSPFRQDSLADSGVFGDYTGQSGVRAAASTARAAPILCPTTGSRRSGLRSTARWRTPRRRTRRPWAAGRDPDDAPCRHRQRLERRWLTQRRAAVRPAAARRPAADRVNLMTTHLRPCPATTREARRPLPCPRPRCAIRPSAGAAASARLREPRAQRVANRRHDQQRGAEAPVQANLGLPMAPGWAGPARRAARQDDQG